MSSRATVELVADFTRVDSPPEDLSRLTAALEQTIGAEETRETLDVRADLMKRLWEVRLVRDRGEPMTLGSLAARIHEVGGAGVLENLTPETFFETSPFRELGLLPVTDDPAATANLGVRRLRELTHFVRRESTLSMPVRPAGVGCSGNTFWLRRANGFWTIPLFVIQYWASSEVTADGMDGAPYAGPLYAMMSATCLSWKIPEGAGPLVESSKQMREAFCGVARQAPEVPFPCYELSVEVISGGVGFSIGSSKKTEYGVSYVKDTLTKSGTLCPLGVSSQHYGFLWQGKGQFSFGSP